MGGARGPAFFQERMAKIHKQLSVSIQKMIDGSHLSWNEIFGTAIPSGTQTYYRSTMMSRGVVQPASEHIKGGPFFKLMIKDLASATFLIKDEINVAMLFWPEQLESWKQAAVTGERDLTTAEIEKDVSKAWEGTNGPAAAVAEVPDFSEVDAAADRMSNQMLEEAKAFQHPADEIAEANLKLAHATAENMIYLRERLDGLIANPPAVMPTVMVGFQWMSEIQKQIQRVEEKVDKLIAVWITEKS